MTEGETFIMAHLGPHSLLRSASGCLLCMQGKYGNLDASVVSYGPCQTPTLNFCVERHQKISSFQPEPFWVVRPHVSKGGQSITLEWGRGRLFDMDVAQMFKKVVADGQQLKVYSAWVSLPVAACCCSLLPIAAHCCPLLPRMVFL